MSCLATSLSLIYNPKLVVKRLFLNRLTTLYSLNIVFFKIELAVLIYIYYPIIGRNKVQKGL